MSIVGTSLWRCTVRLHASAYVTVWRNIEKLISELFVSRDTMSDVFCNRRANARKKIRRFLHRFVIAVRVKGRKR